MKRLLVCLALAALSAPAPACGPDKFRNAGKEERDLRAAYMSVPAPAAPSAPWPPLTAGWVGIGLITGLAAVCRGFGRAD